MSAIAEIFEESRGRPFSDRDALTFSARYNEDLSSWWNDSPRGTWMILVAATCGIPPRRLVLSTLECVQLGLRFVEERTSELNALLTVAIRTANGAATTDACHLASDDASAIQTKILEDCSGADTLAAARATGAIGTAIAAAAFSDNLTDCLQILNSAMSQVAAAGINHEGANSMPALHSQSAQIIRRCISVDEMEWPIR